MTSSPLYRKCKLFLIFSFPLSLSFVCILTSYFSFIAASLLLYLDYCINLYHIISTPPYLILLLNTIIVAIATTTSLSHPTIQGQSSKDMDIGLLDKPLLLLQEEEEEEEVGVLAMAQFHSLISTSKEEEEEEEEEEGDLAMAQFQSPITTSKEEEEEEEERVARKKNGHSSSCMWEETKKNTCHPYIVAPSSTREHHLKSLQKAISNGDESGVNMKSNSLLSVCKTLPSFSTSHDLHYASLRTRNYEECENDDGECENDDDADEDEKEDGFSQQSLEEFNQWVEDFIFKFNQQLRLEISQTNQERVSSSSR